MIERVADHRISSIRAQSLRKAPALPPGMRSAGFLTFRAQLRRAILAACKSCTLWPGRFTSLPVAPPVMRVPEQAVGAMAWERPRDASKGAAALLGEAADAVSVASAVCLHNPPTIAGASPDIGPRPRIRHTARRGTPEPVSPSAGHTDATPQPRRFALENHDERCQKCRRIQGSYSLS